MRPSFDDPDAAAAFFAMKRGITAGTDVHALYAAARERLARMERGSRIAVNAAAPTLSAGSWTFLGPGNFGGRTRALLIDPNQPNVLYAGAVSGGVWKSTSGGATWTPLGVLPNLSVCALAFDPHDSATIYAGTGEGYFREDVRGTALPIAGDGIFVTHDGGSSWTHLPFTAGNPDFQFVNDVVVNDRAVYASTRSGVWRSLDGGATWSRVVQTTVKGGCFDLALGGGDSVLATCGIFEQATVYRTSDGESWSAVLTDPAMGRTSLAVAPSNPSIVYALAACNPTQATGCHDQGLLGIYRSDSGGAAGSWHTQLRWDDQDRVAQTLLSNRNGTLADVCFKQTPGWSNMGWHSNVIAVDPKNPERIWTAGVDLFRSDDGGHTWGAASYWDIAPSAQQYVHADQHAIVFDPHYDGAGNQTAYFTNDGGVFRSDNVLAQVAKGASAVCNPANVHVRYTSLNHDFGVTQFYSGAALPDGSAWFGGAQDNGTALGDTTSGVNGWTEIFGGDGGPVAVDPVRPQTIYVSYQNAAIARSDDGGGHFAMIHGGNAAFLFVSPYLVDPNDHDRLFLGGNVLVRWNAQTKLWSSASASVPGGAKISALAAAAGRPGFVLAGTTSGAILRSTNATTSNASTAWTPAHPRDGFVSSVTIDPSNPDTAYATYAGFGGGAHVWRSLDGGATWSPLDGNGVYTIPDIPVHALAIDGARLFLGTDLGILISTDAGATWHPETQFPAVITESVFLGQGPRGRALYAFTHGRGAWRADFDAPPRRRAAR